MAHAWAGHGWSWGTTVGEWARANCRIRRNHLRKNPLRHVRYCPDTALNVPLDPMANGRVFSIGYGSQTQSEVLDQLARTSITFVIDVRSSPFSRFQPDFSQEPLSRALQDRKIKYVFMGDLLGGRPEDAGCYTEGRVDYAKTRSKDFFKRGVDRLRAAHSKGLQICMLCSEGQPSQCHRSKLIGEALAEHGIDVTHILPDGRTKSQAEVIAQLTDGQYDMFGDQFMSRKTYR